MKLFGNHPLAADRNPSIAILPPDKPLTMALELSLRNQAELNQLIADQQNLGSPRYHQWLTADQFAAQFGPVQEQADAVAAWLSSQGFKSVSSDLRERVIRFSGTVAQAQAAFHVSIYSFGGRSFGNVEDPEIPAQFAGVISAIHGLHNMQAAMATSRGHFPELDPVRIEQKLNTPDPSEPFALLTGDLTTMSDSGFDAKTPDYKLGTLKTFNPADFRTFYDENLILNNGIDGGGASGDCIAIVGDSDYQQSSVDTFNSTFGLPGSSITPYVVNDDPGYNVDELEAELDLEWSHAVAPGATQRFYLADSSAPTIGAIVDQINAAVTDDQCGVISISFGLCGGGSSFYTGTLSPIYTQAAAQGQSIFVAAGDWGSAGIAYDIFSGGCIIGTSPNVNELGTDPNVTTVGGESFTPKYNTESDDTSTVSGLTPRVWNDPHDGKKTGGATGGGASVYYTKPNYQTGPGVPDDGARDVPDIVMIASPYFPGAATFVDNDCFSFGCDGFGTPTVYPFGGTSLSAPVMAGVTKLIAEAKSEGRVGPLNPTLYAIANGPDSAGVFKDVITGNNGYNGVTGFNAGPGFDLSTGWGTFDIAALVDETIGAPLPGPPSLKISPAETLAFGNVDYAAAGSASVIKTLTLTNPASSGRLAQIFSISGPSGVTADPACITTIASGAKPFKCNITFAPQALGALSGGILTINSNAAASPQAISVTGTGVQGKLTVTPASLSFTKVPVNTTSAAKLVTLNNKTGSSFTISSISTGNPALFAATGCVGVLAANSSCQVSLTYTPSATAKLTDTLTIVDDASGGQQTVKLTGTGQ